MKRKLLIWNVIWMLITMIFAAFFYVKEALTLKSLASISFVILATGNLISLKKDSEKVSKSSLVLFLGIVFCMIADVAIEFEFAIGAAVFALGHICYFIVYCCRQKFSFQDLLYGIPAFLASFYVVLFYQDMVYEPEILKVVCVVYAVIISVMAGKSLANYWKEKKVVNAVLTAGSWIFLVSDIMLVISMFAGKPTYVFCVFLYYPAQCIMSHALYQMKKEQL